MSGFDNAIEPANDAGTCPFLVLSAQLRPVEDAHCAVETVSTLLSVTVRNNLAVPPLAHVVFVAVGAGENLTLAVGVTASDRGGFPVLGFGVSSLLTPVSLTEPASEDLPLAVFPTTPHAELRSALALVVVGAQPLRPRVRGASIDLAMHATILHEIEEGVKN